MREIHKKKERERERESLQEVAISIRQKKDKRMCHGLFGKTFVCKLIHAQKSASVHFLNSFSSRILGFQGPAGFAAAPADGH
jgi:hypothetical protein